MYKNSRLFTAYATETTFLFEAKILMCNFHVIHENTQKRYI